MKQFKLLLILIFVSSLAIAGGLKIKVELPAAAGQDVLLAHYQTSRVLINDTIRLDKNGNGIFKSDTLLPQGLYKIYFNDKKHFDFLLSADQQFTISNPGFQPDSIKMKGSEESEAFVEYMHFLSGQQAKRRKLEGKWKDATPEEKKAYQKEINLLTEELQGYWKKTAERYPDTWLASFLMANYVPEPVQENIPPAIAENDSLFLRYKFDFQKNHYFDYFDVTDERFLNTPLLTPKLETYFSKILYQMYDSVRIGVMDLIEKSHPSKPMFRYITSYFLNESINSKLMGMDALFVDIAKNYYLSGEAFWADSTTLAKIRENVIFSEHNLIGMKAPQLVLEGIEGGIDYSLYQIPQKITLLLIFEPNCSHCKVYVPKLYNEVYLPYRDYGLEVYAIYSMDNHKEWEEFVAEHELYDWINVWDPHNSSGFKILLDARTTPQIYLLDEEKNILAKKLSVDQVKRIVEMELK